jgi:hypothetical protein
VRQLSPSALRDAAKAAEEFDSRSWLRLGISINTVRRHIMAVYDKLQVNSRLEAVSKLGRL